jgi:signal peptidase I
MTFPFGDLPRRPDRRSEPDDSENGDSESASRPRFREDDLWAREHEIGRRELPPAGPEPVSPAQEPSQPNSRPSWNEEPDEQPLPGWQPDTQQPETAVNGHWGSPVEAAAARPPTREPLAGRELAYRRSSFTEPDAFDDGWDDYADETDSVAETAGGSDVARRFRNVGWELAQTLVLAALIFLMVRGVAQNFRVEGPSMEPGLHNGQYLLVNKAVYFRLDLERLSRFLPFIDPGDDPQRFLFNSPKRGDVVVFRYPQDPSRDFIKRVIGVPGDTVAIQSGQVYVNGVALDEPYITNPQANNASMEPRVVPPRAYFVLGDNRANSSDSRSWGFVPEENIIGKAMFSYWPLSELGGVGNRSIDLGLIKLPLP